MEGNFWRRDDWMLIDDWRLSNEMQMFPGGCRLVWNGGGVPQELKSRSLRGSIKRAGQKWPGRYFTGN